MRSTYGDANWPNPGLNTFTFTVPGAATNGRAGEVAQIQASLVGGAAAALDGSHVVGPTVLLT